MLVLHPLTCKNDTFPDTIMWLVTLQTAEYGTTANPGQQQPEVTNCDGLQEKNHITVSPTEQER